MKNLFHRKQEDSTVLYKSDKNWNCMTFDSPEHLARRLNDLLLDYWECTPFSTDHSVPTILVSTNEDGTANFSYIDGQLEDLDSVKGCSCWYTIDHEGMAHVKEFNEVLDLKDFRQLLGIAATIIQDVYGEFDIQKVTKLFFESNIQDKND